MLHKCLLNKWMLPGKVAGWFIEKAEKIYY